MKKRRLLGCLFACISAVLFVKSCTAVGADVSAAVVAHAANGQTVTLTSAQTVALFGQTIDCKYLTRPAGVDTWVDGQFTYIATETFPTIGGVHFEYYSPAGQQFEGRSIALYSMAYPADLSISQNSVAMLKLQTSVDLSSVDYIDGAVIQNTGSAALLDLNSVPYAGLGVNYIHTDFGDFDMLRAAAMGDTKYNYAGWFDNSINVKCTIIPYYLNTSSTRSASIGWAQCSCVRNSENRIIIGLVAPILSDNWVLSGNTGAGEGSSGSGSDSGGSSGSGSVDMSGVETRLDDIIDKLDAIIAEMQDDDESSGGGSSSSDSITSFDSAPSDFDFDAAAVAAAPAFDMPFLAPADTPTGGSGLALDSGAAIDSSAVEVTQSALTDGIGLWWWLLSQITGKLPVISSLIMANLTISLACYFIFRGD